MYAPNLQENIRTLYLGQQSSNFLDLLIYCCICKSASKQKGFRMSDSLLQRIVQKQ